MEAGGGDQGQRGKRKRESEDDNEEATGANAAQASDKGSSVLPKNWREKKNANKKLRRAIQYHQKKNFPIYHDFQNRGWLLEDEVDECGSLPAYNSPCHQYYRDDKYPHYAARYAAYLVQVLFLIIKHFQFDASDQVIGEGVHSSGRQAMRILRHRYIPAETMKRLSCHSRHLWCRVETDKREFEMWETYQAAECEYDQVMDMRNVAEEYFTSTNYNETVRDNSPEFLSHGPSSWRQVVEVEALVEVLMME